ncbi:MAG: PIN domain-containing protein [Microcella sp.]
MAVTTWLIDKSAYIRLDSSPDIDLWANRIARGLVHVSGVTRLEVGYSMRSGRDFETEFGTPPLSLLPVEHLTPGIEERALEIQRALALKGLHRAPSIPDLLIAATAELAGCTVLAVDKDFDIIATETGQPVEWLPT